MYQNINKELAKIFKNMSHIYEFLDDKFRALAYAKAAQIIEDLPDDIRNYIVTGKINDIRGIGSHTVDKILEYIKTRKIQKYEELKKLIPEDFLELMEVPGFGPKTLKEFMKSLVLTIKRFNRSIKRRKSCKAKGFWGKESPKYAKRS
jgi:DNA polymerase IV (family X)